MCYVLAVGKFAVLGEERDKFLEDGKFNWDGKGYAGDFSLLGPIVYGMEIYWM